MDRMISKTVKCLFSRIADDEPKPCYYQPMKVTYVEDKYGKRLDIVSQGIGYQITVPLDEVIA